MKPTKNTAFSLSSLRQGAFTPLLLLAAFHSASAAYEHRKERAPEYKPRRLVRKGVFAHNTEFQVIGAIPEASSVALALRPAMKAFDGSTVIGKKADPIRAGFSTPEVIEAKGEIPAEREFEVDVIQLEEAYGESLPAILDALLRERGGHLSSARPKAADLQPVVSSEGRKFFLIEHLEGGAVPLSGPFFLAAEPGLTRTPGVVFDRFSPSEIDAHAGEKFYLVGTPYEIDLKGGRLIVGPYFQ